MILPIKILKDDFFRLLKHRIPTAYSTRYTEDFGEKLIFKETIDALKQLDSFAQEIREDIWNADSLTFKFRHQEDQQQLAEFCDSFNQLRLKKDLFPHPEIFNHLFFKSVYEGYVQFDKSVKYSLSQKYAIDSYQLVPEDMQFEYAKDAFILDDYSRLIPWTSKTFPYQHISQLITHVRDQIERGINEDRKQEKYALDKLSQQAEDFNGLLRTHSSVYVLAIDIRIQGFFKPQSNLLTQVGDMHHNNLYNIKLLLARFFQLLSGLTKIETNATKEDLNLHCILMLKPSKEFSENSSIDMLQQQIQHLMGSLYHVEIRNWNELIRRNYSKTAVGLIKISQQKNIEAFKYWVLSFFFTFDLYIQPKLQNHLKNTLAINENLSIYIGLAGVGQREVLNECNDSIKDSLKEIEKVKSTLDQIFKPFLSEKERKSVWSTSRLSKTSQAYIEAVMHYYREIESDPKKVQTMMQIEIFIETLVTTQRMAFELSVSSDTDQLTRQVLRGAITRLGQQFIMLGENQVETDDIKTIQSFRLHENDSFEKSRDSLKQLTSLQVSPESINHINLYILVLRNIFTKSSSGYNDKSIKEIRIDAYKKYKDHLKAATTLFPHLMKKDCLILRVVIELIPESEPIPQEKLAFLWSKFLHHAQTAKPLSWKTGYFGLWHENEEQHFYADVFIVLDDRAFADPTSIIQALNMKWVKFVKNKAQSILEMDEKPNFKSCKIQGKSIMQTNEEYSLNRLLIESTNEQRKLDFLQKIIPTFLSHSIFMKNSIKAHRYRQEKSDSGFLIKSSSVVAERKNASVQKSSNKKILKASVDNPENTGDM